MSRPHDLTEQTHPAGQIRAAVAGDAPARPRRLARLSLVLFVLLPALLFGLYNLFAAERYASGASFVVRSVQAGQGSGDLLDSISGSVSAGSTKSDSYIVRRYLESADLMREIDREFDLQAIYGAPRGDVLQRLRADASFEEKLAYWQRRAHSSYDHTTGILTLEIQAFDPGEAERLAISVMERLRGLVNELSHSARETSLAHARAELAGAEVTLREAQQAIKRFRAEHGFADLTLSAGRDDMLISELNRQIIAESANLEVRRIDVRNPGPNITRLEQKIAALEGQRDQLLGDRGGDHGAARLVSAEEMGEYESLLLDVEIARTRYVSTLDGMESARRDAERQQRYLAVFSEPYATDRAQYPRRIINSAVTFLGLLAIWAIACFLIQMVRDHRK